MNATAQPSVIAMTPRGLIRVDGHSEKHALPAGWRLATADEAENFERKEALIARLQRRAPTLVPIGAHQRLTDGKALQDGLHRQGGEQRSPIAVAEENAKCAHAQAAIAVDERMEVQRKLAVQQAMNEKMLDFILALRTRLAANPATAAIVAEIDKEMHHG